MRVGNDERHDAACMQCLLDRFVGEHRSFLRARDSMITAIKRQANLANPFNLLTFLPLPLMPIRSKSPPK
jgi:hypothetical protein